MNPRVSRKSKSVFHDDENSHIVDFPDEPVIESQPFERAIEVRESNQGHRESPPAAEAQQQRPVEVYDEQDQHSFMQESSLQQIFPHSGRRAGGGGMVHLESGLEGKSQISRPSRFTTSGLPAFSDLSKPRVSDFNAAGMPVQKQDMSHISDDDLHFFLGIQQASQPNQASNNGSASVVDPAHGQPSLEFSLEKRVSNGNNLGSFRHQYSAQPSDRDLYEIKEIMESTPKESHKSPQAAADEKPQVQEEAKKAAIPEAQKWAPPPRLRNLRSKKNRKGQATGEQKSPAAPIFAASTAIEEAKGSAFEHVSPERQ